MTGSGIDEVRRSQIAARLAAVREQIANAARRSGRAAEDIVLIGITKTWPASDVRILNQLGVVDIGENKAQELSEKSEECQDLPIHWHFVGQLQRNKARVVTELADVVHSVDRASLVTALNRHSAELRDEPLKCLIQVNLDPEPEVGRGGVAPSSVAQLADLVAESEGLSLGGVMGVASQSLDASQCFDALAHVSQEIRGQHPSATVISAGMSGDYAAAIAAGATHIRLGAALLGQRPIVR